MSEKNVFREALQPESMQVRREDLLETTRECLASEDFRTLRLFLNGLHPAELAELFRQLDEDEQQRKLRVSLGMGLFLGLLVFVVARVWTGSSLVGGCVGVAMFAAVVVVAVMGAAIPLFFRTTGIDPAIASGPLPTTLNDGLSLLIYFFTAAALLSLFPAGVWQ